MKPTSIEKLKIVAEAFRVSSLLAAFNADGIYGREEFPVEAADEIAGDMAIIVDRIRAAQDVLDEFIPGFSALVAQADAEAQARANKKVELK